MGESNKDELAQLGKGGTRISYQGRRVTRDILHVCYIFITPDHIYNYSSLM